MIETFLQKVDHGGRAMLPSVTAFVCTLLGTVVWPLPYLGSVVPPLALMAIYYWAMHRPDLFRPSMAFVIGLLNDVINQMPLGLSALLFVGVHQLVFQQRRYFVGHSFFMMWFGFFLTVFVVTLTEWGLLCIVKSHMIPVMPAIMQILLASALFPLPCWLFILIQRHALNSDGE